MPPASNLRPIQATSVQPQSRAGRLSAEQVPAPEKGKGGESGEEPDRDHDGRCSRPERLRGYQTHVGKRREFDEPLRHWVDRSCSALDNRYRSVNYDDIADVFDP
jgi:hypothetical protein